jgi:hypothetical protein
LFLVEFDMINFNYRDNDASHLKTKAKDVIKSTGNERIRQDLGPEILINFCAALQNKNNTVIRENKNQSLIRNNTSL